MFNMQCRKIITVEDNKKMNITIFINIYTNIYIYIYIICDKMTQIKNDSINSSY